MSNSFTQVFGGTTIYPADVSYLPLALTGNISLEWPLEATAGSTVVARIIDITPSGAYTITMPEATAVSVGQTVLFNNLGPSTVAVNKANGSAILSIGAGEQWQAYLIDNTTVGGTWRTLRYGAATAQAQAAALAGPGLVTDGSQLAQNYEVIDFSVTPYTLTGPDRAKVFVWDGGLGTLNLPSAPAAGDGWFVQVRNAGQGDLTIDPSGTELINAGSTLRLQPGDSAVIVSNGTQWFTIGLGQQAVFAFDYTSIAVTGGTYTLSGSELNRIAYKFTGTLVSNVTVVVPATVQQYWVNNSTTGAFTLSLQASGSGTSTPVTQASTSILYCDGTDIIPATTAVTFAGILPVSQGGTGANNAASARTNLGATGIGSSLFTATSAASARSTISAASSGANSDITSLSGLTTPLSVGQGGTGAATLTANGVVVGNGTSAVQVTAAGTTGQVLVGNTGGAPSWATLTGIGVTSFSGGTTGLTPASPTTGAITLAGTLGVANGGTGNTTFLSNYLLKGNGTSAVTSSIVYDNGTNVGIATSSPTERLTVAGNTKIGEGVASNTSKFMVNTLSGVAAGIQLIQDANESWIIQNPASSTALTFSASGAERMRITTGGFVGIGTSTPGTRLDVSGGDVYRISRVSTATGGVIEMGLLGQSIIGIQSLTNLSNFQSLILNPNGGDVGIGTSTPTSRLHVNSGASTTSAMIESTGTSAFIGLKNSGATAFIGSDSTGALLVQTPGSGFSTKMFVGSTGNVGIGTSIPAYMLDILGASNTQLSIRTPDLAAGTVASPIYQAIRFFGYSGTERARIVGIDTASNNVNGQLAFSTGQGGTMIEAMRIDAVGQVGIGTDSPSATLHATVGSAGAGTMAQLLLGYLGGSTNYYTGNTQIFRTGNTTETMRIDSSGNVGIGTNAPGVALDVTGSIRASQSITVGSGGTYQAGSIFSDSQWGMIFRAKQASPSQAYFRWADSSDVELMRIDALGSLGLGTTTPGYKLDVSTGGTNALRLAGPINVLSDLTDGTITLRQQIGNEGAIGTVGAHAFILRTNNTERMRIDSSGNVGIGTSSPQAKVEVNGDLDGVYNANVLVTSTANTAKLAFNPTGVSSSGVGNVGGGLVFYASGANTERMRIDASGNVLVGRTTPYAQAYRMVVSADSGLIAVPMAINDDRSGTSDSRILAFLRGGTETGYITSSPSVFSVAATSALAFQTASSEQMRITNTGNVGIGTTTPNVRLDVNGGSGIIVGDTSLTSSQVNIGIGLLTAGRPFVGTNDNTNPLEVGTRAAMATVFVTDSTERMRITSAGNVGIGTSTPALNLVVSDAGAAGLEFSPTGGIGGGTYIQAFNRSTSAYTPITNYASQHTWYAGSARAMDIDSSGNVGIGTTSPTSKLYVEGTIQARSGSTGVLIYGDGSGAGYVQSVGNTDPLIFQTGINERMRLDGSGNLLVGTTSTSVYNSASATGHVLEANGTVQHSRSGFAAMLLNRTSSDGNIVEFFRGGTVVGSISVTGSATAYNTSSDYRLKNVDGPITNSGAYVDALKPVQGSWKSDGSRFIGLLAHEVQEVSETPIATGEKDGEQMQAMDYSAPELIANLIAEIQSLRARVAQLEERK